MKITRVEWKKRRIMKQYLAEVFMTLSDGTVLISSQNLPKEMQMANTESFNSVPEMVTDDPVIIGLVSELIYALKNDKFIEKVEVR